MYQMKRFLARGLVLACLVWLLAACGVDILGSQPPAVPPASSLSIMEALEQDLNQGKADKALELFSDEAMVLAVHPGASGNDQTSGYYTAGGYFIPRAYSPETTQTLYQGHEQVNTYLATLIAHHFHSSDSSYQEDEVGVTWRCQTSNPIEFKATFEEGQIQTLIVTVA